MVKQKDNPVAKIEPASALLKACGHAQLRMNMLQIMQLFLNFAV